MGRDSNGLWDIAVVAIVVTVAEIVNIERSAEIKRAEHAESDSGDLENVAFVGDVHRLFRN